MRVEAKDTALEALSLLLVLRAFAALVMTALLLTKI
jgi:hypothetical protein